MSESHHPSEACALSIVVPVLNEAENIAAVTEEVVTTMSGAVTFEIVFVDDGSTDGTAAEIREAAARWPEVRLIRHPRCAGKSQGLISGITAARGTWIATMDGDGQNDPADVLNMYLTAREQAGDGSAGALIVAGARRKRRDTWLKRVSSRVANRVRARVLGDATPDTGCGLKVFERERYLALPAFDNMHRFLPALFQMHGGRALSVPVADRPRAAGESKYGFHNRLWVGITDLIGVSWLKRRALLPVASTEERLDV